MIHTTSYLKTVLYVIPSANFGGAETNVIRLIQGLDKQRFQPIVIVPKKGQVSALLELAGIPTFVSGWPHHFFSHSFIENWIFQFRLSRFLQPYRIDLIHNNSMLSLSVALTLSKHLNCPMITHWHDNRCPVTYRNLLQNAAQMPIIAVAKTVKETLQSALSTQRSIHVIYNGIDSNSFCPSNMRTERKQLNLDPDLFLIGFCSRITPEKGLHTLINALSKLPNYVHLLVAGTWGSSQYNDEITKLINSHSCKSRVHFMGFHEHISPIINACNIIAIPSDTEAFPLISLEAMACSKPVLCHDVGGLNEQLDHDKEGFFIHSHNVDDWVYHVTLLIEDSNKYNRMSAAALKKSKHFTLKKSINLCEQFYLETLNSWPN